MNNEVPKIAIFAGEIPMFDDQTIFKLCIVDQQFYQWKCTDLNLRYISGRFRYGLRGGGVWAPKIDSFRWYSSTSNLGTVHEMAIASI